MTIRISHDKTQIKRIADRHMSRVDKRLERALNVSAAVVHSEFLDGIQRGDKTGRVYRKTGGILHTASAPGEYPATDTGRLAGSLIIKRARKRGLSGWVSEVRAGIGREVIYLRFLVRMKRLGLHDALEKSSRKIIRIINGR